MIIAWMRQLKSYYENSLFSAAMKSIGKKIMHAWQTSIFGSCFIQDQTDEALYYSGAQKVLSASIRFWNKSAAKLSDLLNNSVKNSLFYQLAKAQISNALIGDSRFYGAMLLTYGFGGLLLDFGFGAGFFIRLFLILVGALLLWLNQPILFWLKGSLIFRFAEAVLGAEIEIERLRKMKSKNSILLGVLNGILMAGSGLLLPAVLTPGIFFGITGLLVLLWRYEVGVYLLIFSAPILPTMACAGIAMLAILSFFLRCMMEKRSILKWNAVSFAVLGFLLILGFFAVTSFTPVKSVPIFILYALFISMYFLIINAVKSKKSLYWMIAIFLTSGLLVSLYGIYQQFFGSNVGHAWIDEDMFEEISIRVYSTLENPNVLGEYLLLLIPLAIAMVWASKGFLSKLYYLGIFGAASLCLVFTQSRGCWIGIMIGLFVYIFLINKRYLSLFFIALLAAPFILPPSILNRFLSIGNTTDTSTSYRVYIWLGTLAMLKDFWPYGLGLGIDAFNKVYPFYSYSNIYAPHSHNIYLQLLVETGIAGFCAMLAILLLFWRKLVNLYTHFGKKPETVFAVAVLAGSIAFMVQGAFDYVWYNYRVFLIFWMVLAMGMSAHQLLKAGAELD